MHTVSVVIKNPHSHAVMLSLSWGIMKWRKWLTPNAETTFSESTSFMPSQLPELELRASAALTLVKASFGDKVIGSLPKTGTMVRV